MTMVMRRDSDGISHQIWSQRQVQSCAIASIVMARNRVFQMSFMEDEWNLAWRSYNSVFRGGFWSPVLPPPAPMTIVPRARDGESFQATFERTFSNDGTTPKQIESIIRQERMEISKKDHSGDLYSPTAKATVDGSLLGPSTPALIMLYWVRGMQIVGGHAVLAVRRTSAGRIVYLDPWHGCLREYLPGVAYDDDGVIKVVLYLQNPAMPFPSATDHFGKARTESGSRLLPPNTQFPGGRRSER